VVAKEEYRMLKKRMRVLLFTLLLALFALSYVIVAAGPIDGGI